MSSERPEWLVVGAGFTGAVLAERIANQLGMRVLLIDRRNHVGGNAHDALNEHGILVHTYGPHIFHTNAPRIWEYLSNFTDWRPYEHRVLGEVEGQLVPIPFNLTSLERLMPRAAHGLERDLIDTYGYGARVAVLAMRESPSPAIRRLADFIYEMVFLNYTVKQWGVTPEALDASVTARVPILISRDDRYFQDAYQAMPAEGYSALFRRMLDHPLIDIALHTPLSAEILASVDRVIYTGPIDEYFGNSFGPLEYRSIRFEFETFDDDTVFPVGTLNFPNKHEYTRRTEFKHLTGQKNQKTTVVAEYPMKHVPGMTEPYYPVPRAENRTRFDQYRSLASKLSGSTIFAGRLADYRYYNMDQAVGRAISVFEKVVVPLANVARSGGSTQ